MKFGFRTSAIDAFRAALTFKVGEAHNSTLQLARLDDGRVEIQATDGIGVVCLPATVTDGVEFDALLLTPMSLKVPSGMKSGIDVIEFLLDGDSFADLNGWAWWGARSDRKIGGMQAGTGKTMPVRKVVPDALPLLPAAPPYAFDAVHAANVLRAARTAPRYPITVQLPSGAAAFRWAFEGGGDYTIVCGRADDFVQAEFARVLELHRIARVGGRAYQEALEAEMTKKGATK